MATKPKTIMERVEEIFMGETPAAKNSPRPKATKKSTAKVTKKSKPASKTKRKAKKTKKKAKRK